MDTKNRYNWPKLLIVCYKYLTVWQHRFSQQLSITVEVNFVNISSFKTSLKNSLTWPIKKGWHQTNLRKMDKSKKKISGLNLTVALRLTFFDVLKSVSYTHLDVYKRQPLTDLHQKQYVLRTLQFRAVYETLFDSVWICGCYRLP